MTKDEALKMAIEALNDSLTRFSTFNEMQHDAIQACKDALEQPSWQGLSQQEIGEAQPPTDVKMSLDEFFDTFARAIEQALKEKNTP